MHDYCINQLINQSGNGNVSLTYGLYTLSWFSRLQISNTIAYFTCKYTLHGRSYSSCQYAFLL